MTPTPEGAGVELRPDLNEVLEFLYGAAPLDGAHFGELPPDGKPRYWWRSKLKAAISSALAPSAPAAAGMPTPIATVEVVKMGDDGAMGCCHLEPRGWWTKLGLGKHALYASLPTPAPGPSKALQALEDVIPPHLRSNRHGDSFMGERYEIIRAALSLPPAAPGWTDAQREQMLDELINTHGIQGDIEEILDVVLGVVAPSPAAPIGEPTLLQRLADAAERLRYAVELRQRLGPDSVKGLVTADLLAVLKEEFATRASPPPAAPEKEERCPRCHLPQSVCDAQKTDPDPFFGD